MKNASAATLAILAAGQYILAELYDITLPTGQIYRFTSFQTPLNNITIYLPGGVTAGPFNYQTGLTITRDTITQKAGVEAGNMKVTLSPQPDSPNAPVLIAGYSPLLAARYGFLDGAQVRLSKLFMNLPQYTGGQLDTSPGAVGWFLGTVQDVEADRLNLLLTVDDYLAYLGMQQMPKNLWQVGCFHQVYDAGCTLLKSAFLVSGTIVSAGDAAHFTTGLTQVDGYFKLGILTFTTGVLTGQSANVASYKQASGAVALRFPFPKLPSAGDVFSIYPGCDLQQATCSNSNAAVGPPFNNLAHFGGQPYIPVAETILDGGTDNPPVQTRGAQAGQIIGSQPTGRIVVGGYKA